MIDNQLSLPVQLPDHQDFDNYATGDNALAIQHLQTLAAVKVHSTTYISGGLDTGKTHLLYAVCATIQGTVFIDCASLDGLSWQMLEGLEYSPAVCIDNIHLLVQLPEWQAAVFDLINRAREIDKCHLIFTASMGAKQLALELPDLNSRLAWGVSFHLKPLTDSQREALLRLRASQRGLDMPSDVAKYLLSHGQRDIATLMLTLDKLDRLSLQQQRRLTIPFVKQILA